MFLQLNLCLICINLIKFCFKKVAEVFFFLKFVRNQIESVRTFFASNTFCVASVAESQTQECA